MELSPAELKALDDLSDEDLAPPPSSEEVFGAQLDRLKEQYEEDSNRLQNQTNENKERVHSKLEETLALRRQRRARRNIEEKEKAALTGS